MKKRFLSIAAFAMAMRNGQLQAAHQDQLKAQLKAKQAEGGALDDKVLTVAMECGYAPL